MLTTWLRQYAPSSKDLKPPTRKARTKLGDAVSYTLNQWDYLTRYTSDGRMPFDSNTLERDIRVFATGRKSWLFSDTVDGAKASAVIYSLMLTSTHSPGCATCSLSCRSAPKRPRSATCYRSTSPKPLRPNRAGYCYRCEGRSAVPQTSMRMENRAYTRRAPTAFQDSNGIVHYFEDHAK